MNVYYTNDFRYKEMIGESLFGHVAIQKVKPYRESFLLFEESIEKEIFLEGRNKKSWEQYTKNGIKEVEEDFAKKIFKPNNFWHYHCGKHVGDTIKAYHKKNFTHSDISEKEVKFWIPNHIKNNIYSENLINIENRDGLVCNFIIHYIPIEDYEKKLSILVLCGSLHDSWEELSKNT